MSGSKCRCGLLALGAAFSSLLAFLLVRRFPYRILEREFAFCMTVTFIWLALVSLSLVLGIAFVWKLRRSGLIGRGKALLYYLGIWLVAGFYLSVAAGNIVHSVNLPQNVCANNLRMILSAKQQFGRAYDLTNGSSVSAQDLAAFINKPFRSIKCPEGGEYAIGVVGVGSLCSVHGTLSDILPAEPKECKTGL